MIYQYKDIDKLKKELEGKKIVLVEGCFDILHQGHIDFIKQAKAYGDELVVAVMSDHYVNFHKGKGHPALPQEVRAAVVDAIKGVSQVIAMPPDLMEGELPILPKKVLADLKPDVYVTRNKIWEKFSPELSGLGVKLVVLDSPALNSSTKIIRQIREVK